MGVRLLLRDETLTARIIGEIDHHTARMVREEIDSTAQKVKPLRLCLDFSEVPFMDSSGIGVIMGRYKKVYMMGGEVWAVHTNERMKKILTMSGVMKIMQIYEEDK